jgi:molybdate transport system regulatory protein
LETGEGMFFGAGRALLLAKIEEHGSLKKAAEDLGMSYRAAWGRLKSSENRLGHKLAEKVPAEGRGQKLILTPLAEALIDDFLELEKLVLNFIKDHQKKIIQHLEE